MFSAFWLWAEYLLIFCKCNYASGGKGEDLWVIELDLVNMH